METSNRLIMKQDKRDNTRIMLTTMLLYLIGVVFVFSASSASLIMNGNENITSFVEKQIFFGVIAIIGGIICSKINPRFFIKHQKQIFYFTLAILAVVLVVAPEVKGARSWLKIGGFGIQPAEFAKLTLILMASSTLKDRDVNTPETYKKLCIYTLPILALVVLQGDLGTVMIMGAILLAMMYLSGIHNLILGGITLLGIIGVLVLSIISPYRIKRMLIFLNPESDYYGMGYQIIQSLYSIANGGILGQGIGNSIHKFGYLPENHTDFIFSILTEETGFIGSSIVLILFIFLIIHIFKVAFRIQNKQLSLICSGIGCYIAIEALLNLFVVVSLMPVTGVTLPFLSYGGSSLISKFLAVGLVLGASKYAKKTEARELDAERINQAKERQMMRLESLRKMESFRQETGSNIKNVIKNINNKLFNGYRAVATSNKENFKKIISKKPKNNNGGFKKIKKKALKGASLKGPKKQKLTLNKMTKKEKAFLSSFDKKQSNFDSMGLDEMYLDDTGFNSTEGLTEIDLGSIDIKKFNQTR